jgi:Zn-dependent protease
MGDGLFERSITVFRVYGIPIRVHVSLLVLLPYLMVAGSSQFRAFAAQAHVPRAAFELPPMLWGAILAVGLLFAILVHELAHSVVALHRGARIEAITLTMLGGVSEIRGEVPLEREAWMAFAGPLTSAGIAVLSYAVHRVVPMPAGPSIALFLFAFTNAVLALFNLLPAYPMDGGRVLRSLLARRVGRDRATRLAADIGRLLAVVLGILGVMSLHFLLLLVAVFVYLAATAEQQRLRVSEVLRGMPVLRFMSGRLGQAHASESMFHVAERLGQANEVGVRVTNGSATSLAREPEEGEGLGVVTASDLTQQLRRGLSEAPVSSAIRSDRPTVHEGDDAARAFELLSTRNVDAVVVVDSDERVVGLVTAEGMLRTVQELSAGARRVP